MLILQVIFSLHSTRTTVLSVSDVGPGFFLHSEIVAPYLVHYGTAAQKERYLPGMCSGEIITAIAMTEPGKENLHTPVLVIQDFLTYSCIQCLM